MFAVKSDGGTDDGPDTLQTKRPRKLVFEPSPMPENWRDRRPAQYAVYNASAKGRARRRDYRHNRSKHQTDTKYLSREFVAWDGEGITITEGPRAGEHIYVMLANSKGGYTANPKGLSTMEIMRFLLTEYAKYKDCTHVIYGGGYDFNMWLADVPRPVVEGIYTHDYYRWGRLTFQWRRGKSFYLRLDKDTALGDRGMTMYDVVSFFQCSFVKACDSYLGDRFAHRDVIVEQKANRSSFTEADIPDVKLYNSYELENLVALMVELRERLNAVTLRPKRWDGPGAIAAALLSRENVKDAMQDTEETVPQVAEAARYAYAGGRFEPIQYGVSREEAYEYDVNSAYPFALQSVPNLRRGTWEEVCDPDVSQLPAFAIHRVYFKGTDFRLPMPLFWRSAKGNIVYPGDEGHYGWYWTPDVMAGLAYVERYGGELQVLRSWEYHEDNPNDRPFAFIAELYRERQLLKAAGNGAHVGIKLGLNSLYGKLAQQVGARRDGDTGELIKPPFHQLEWAGYVTSVCRSMVYLAAIDDLSSVIAYETDALFTTRPLDVPLGSELGEWEETRFRNLTYVQSGLYFGTTDDGTEVAKTRGVNRCVCDNPPCECGSLTRELVETTIDADDAEERVARAPLTQFITAGLALQGRWRQWRRWITTEKVIRLEPQGKRVPLPGERGEGFSRTFAARVPHEAHSAEFPITWINPDIGMIELEELRNMGSSEGVFLSDDYM